MSLRLFNPAEWPTEQVQRRDGSWPRCRARSPEWHQTALRGPAPSPPGEGAAAPQRDASETSPCRRDGQAKPTARPPQGNGPRGPSARESRPRSAVLPHPIRVGAVLVRLVRRAASVYRAAVARGDRAALDLVVVDVRRPAGHRPGGQSKRNGVGREPQHDGRGRASPDVVRSRSPWLPQFGRPAPRAGPVVSHQGPFMGLFLRRGFRVSCDTQSLSGT
jgi:hypothetical protein